MAALTQSQRDAIVRRCAPLLATYFTALPLRTASLDFGAVAKSPDIVEFHDYLRLATLLPAGKELCEYLARVQLAPAVQQTRTVRIERGVLTGPVDPVGLARRFGQRSTPREFPVRTVTTHHRLPENILTASAAQALVVELQALIGRTSLPRGSSEAELAVHILDAAQAALSSPPISDVLEEAIDLRNEALDDLLGRVDERWRSRHIINRAYADVARWCQRHRHQQLRPGGLIAGVTYSDDFDNRLFEIFTLSLTRSGLESLGFSATVLRPVHRAGELPAMEFSHPDSGTAIDLYFQRASGVVWTESAPRIWEGISGIPDVVLAPRSALHPIVLIDAKNRNRGPTTLDDDAAERQGRHATSDELHKMLGYFANFARLCRAAGRGPVGGLVFSSSTDGVPIWSTTSDSGGLLATIAINPGNAELDEPHSPARRFAEALLRAAGLFGGTRADGTAADVLLAELHAHHPDVPHDPEQTARVSAISAWVEAQYGNEPTRVAGAERTLASHVLGEAARHLSADEMRFLATAEVFWEDHRDAVSMDFGPVVIELAKALESLVNRTIVEPFRVWAAQVGREIGKLDTIGDQRAELERVVLLQPHQVRPRGARSLSDYLDTSGQRQFVLDHVRTALDRVNPVRRDAAHPHRVTSRRAGETRAWLLGVGPEPSTLAHLATELSRPQR